MCLPKWGPGRARQLRPDAIVRARPNRLTLCSVALAGVQLLYWGYAFGGGGSGDSTRERGAEATWVATLYREEGVARTSLPDWIAAPFEHVFIAGQQSGDGWCSFGGGA